MLKKIHVGELRPGMYVVDTGFQWMQRPFLYSREGIVDNEKTVQAIKEDGFLEAFINVARSDPAPNQIHADLNAIMDQALDRTSARRRPARLPLNREIPIARGVYAGAMVCTQVLAEAVEEQTPLDCLRAEVHVEFLLESVSRNPNALICLGKLRKHDAYIHAHCLNVAVLALSFGTYLGLPHPVLHDLGLAAMLHDLGKVAVDQEILQKQGPLTSEEFEQVKRHCVKGYRWLTQGEAGIVRSDVALGVLDHHERRDGSGYPRGLKGGQINPLARVIAIADVYDALTSDRGHQEPLRPDKAMGLLYQMGEKHLFKEYVTLFIRCMGIYPVGTFLQLTNGEFAIVSGVHPEAPHKPRVCVMMDQKMRPGLPRTVDLRRTGDALSVERTLDHREYRVDPMQYIS